VSPVGRSPRRLPVFPTRSVSASTTRAVEKDGPLPNCLASCCAGSGRWSGGAPMAHVGGDLRPSRYRCWRSSCFRGTAICTRPELRGSWRRCSALSMTWYTTCSTDPALADPLLRQLPARGAHRRGHQTCRAPKIGHVLCHLQDVAAGGHRRSCSAVSPFPVQGQGTAGLRRDRVLLLTADAGDRALIASWVRGRRRARLPDHPQGGRVRG